MGDLPWSREVKETQFAQCGPGGIGGIVAHQL